MPLMYKNRLFNSSSSGDLVGRGVARGSLSVSRLSVLAPGSGIDVSVATNTQHTAASKHNHGHNAVAMGTESYTSWKQAQRGKGESQWPWVYVCSSRWQHWNCHQHSQISLVTLPKPGARLPGDRRPGRERRGMSETNQLPHIGYFLPKAMVTWHCFAGYFHPLLYPPTPGKLPQPQCVWAPGTAVSKKIK